MNTSGELLASVIVPTFQRCSSVRRLLEAFALQSLSPASFEVIISVDGSTDGTLEMAKAFQSGFSLNAIWQPNRGRAAACNAGLHQARGEIIVLLDDDMEPAPEFLSAHLAAHAQQNHLGVLGAVPIEYDAQSPQVLQYIGAKFNSHLDRLRELGRPSDLRDFYSGNFSIRRENLVRVGGFDEEFTVYGNEDLELSLRLSEHGIVFVYDTDACAIQHYTKDFAGLARDYVADGRTSVLFASKHPGAVRGLKLSSYHSPSRKWRAVRWCLLTPSTYTSLVPRLIVQLVQIMERRMPFRMQTVYQFTLDYFFWLGARAALGEQGQDLASFTDQSQASAGEERAYTDNLP